MGKTPNTLMKYMNEISQILIYKKKIDELITCIFSLFIC